ncbi:solute carrier family 25 member 46-like [Cimex lectularius]|uniref:Solute carrier family 25 member 46 n=1 Tax=Cimex lectularius TaxID=79782 RepID=A0A8I6SHJ7_CIMLE|nr:solute carrier family 25 member 46-like [Cimex lectularius]
MAGIEGYFGPNMIDEDYEEFCLKRQPKRPNNIELRKFHLQPVAQMPVTPHIDEDTTIQKYVGIGVSLATLLAENLLSHPFVVLRRQCQVNHNSYKYHLVPVTLVPIIMHLHQRQGITTLWKGVGSVLLVRGMTLAIEDLLSKVTTWPKEISWGHGSVKAASQHILLKCVTFCIITPFYSASLVETVQSDIASEKPGMFDVFREGAYRLVSFGSPQKGRMLPVWTLVIPTVMYGLLKYLFGSVIKNVSSSIMHINYRHEHQKKGAYPKDWLNSSILQEIEVTAQLISLIAADVVFYPLETILHRLHLQGTRTIIDNLDTGFSVTPILTAYEGTLDCYDTTLSQEGGVGLFKGFGALILQFTAHYAVLKLTKFILTQVTILIKSTNQPPQTNFPVQVTTPVSHSQDLIRTPIR